MAFPDPIKLGIRQTTRWLVASRQDQHPGIAMLHANYAVGNIDLLRQLWTDKEIAAEGVDINQLAHEAQTLQDRAQRQLMARCEAFGDE